MLRSEGVRAKAEVGGAEPFAQCAQGESLGRWRDFKIQ